MQGATKIRDKQEPKQEENVRPCLADRTVRDEVYAVGVQNGRQPMRYGDRGLALRSGDIQCCLHDLHHT